MTAPAATGHWLFGDQPSFPHAACKGEPADLWFIPEHLSSTSLARRALVNEARAICFACPHRAACADWAIDNPRHTVGGMWGGLTPGQLARERTRRKETAA